MFGTRCNIEFIKPFTTPETWRVDNMAIQQKQMGLHTIQKKKTKNGILRRLSLGADSVSQ